MGRNIETVGRYVNFPLELMGGKTPDNVGCLD